MGIVQILNVVPRTGAAWEHVCCYLFENVTNNNNITQQKNGRRK